MYTIRKRKQCDQRTCLCPCYTAGAHATKHTLALVQESEVGLGECAHTRVANLCKGVGVLEAR